MTTLKDLIKDKNVVVGGVKHHKRYTQKRGIACPMSELDGLLRKIKAEPKVEIAQKIAFGDFALIEVWSSEIEPAFDLDKFVRSLDGSEPEPTDEWTPVSERGPEPVENRYLVTHRGEVFEAVWCDSPHGDGWAFMVPGQKYSFVGVTA